MQLFYNPSLEPGHTHCLFSPEESRHLLKVLRKTEGDVVYLTNGRGCLFKAKIKTAGQTHCAAEILAEEKTTAKKYSLHLAVAPTKMNDRYEWFLEKATEIGVDQITPILCEHSERKTLKPERMQRVLQAAMKQSLQTHLPILNPLIPYREFVEQQISGLKFIAHCHGGGGMHLQHLAVPDHPVTILIGPEGDFSAPEVAQAEDNNFTPVSLGKNRLRTETAAMVACTTIALLHC